MRQVVYVDEIIIVNLVMNLTVLWLTSRFTGKRCLFTRMLAASAVGCIYAIAVLIPGLYLATHILVKFMTAAIMVWISFGLTNWRNFLRHFTCLLLSGFVIGGLAVGLNYLFVSNLNLSANQMINPNYNKWLVLVCTVILTYCIGKWGSTFWFKRVGQITDKIPLTVTLWGRKVAVDALVDTGNQLVDPLSQDPVIIIEYEVIEPLLPEELSSLVSRQPWDGSSIVLLLSDAPYVNRLRVIPFQSLGSQNGMLLGIRPDEIEICIKNRNQIVKNVVVAIYDRKLCPETSYRALLHPQLLAS